MELSKYIVGFMDAHFDSNYVWFANGMSSEVFKYNIFNKELNLDSVLMEDGKPFKMFSRNVIHNEDNIYFVSNRGYKISKCMIDNGKMVLNSVREYENSGSIIIKYAFYINNEIWCVPLDINNKIMIYNIKTDQFYSKLSLKYEFERHKITIQSNLISNINYYKGDFFLTLDNGTELIQYNVESRSVTRYEIPNNLQVSGFDYDGKYFWLRSKYGVSVHKWALNAETIMSYYLDDMNDSEKGECNAKVVVLSNGKVVLLPSYCNSVIYLDQNENCLKRVKGLEDICHVKGKEKYTFSIGNAEINGRLILYPWAGEQLISIDLADMKAETHRLIINEEEHEKLQFFYWRTKQLIYETEENTLSTQLKRLTHPLMDEFELKDSQKKYEKNVGKEIYKLTAKR